MIKTVARSNPLSPGNKIHKYRCGNVIAKVYEPDWRIIPEITDAKEKERFAHDVKKEVIFIKKIDVNMDKLKKGERFVLDGLPVKDIPPEIKATKDIPVTEIESAAPAAVEPKKPGRPPKVEKELEKEPEKVTGESKEFDPMAAIKKKK